MGSSIIRLEEVGKRYRIHRGERHPHLRSALKRFVTSPWKTLRTALLPPSDAESLWALRGVTAEVEAGEVLGVIGRNGAGKTTLLKLLSQITPPSEGRITLHGRVASLLEVGTGFHPEFTGRENIYINGAILGMRKGEIDRKFDDIVAFAEIERFLDTPVKRYSSGMHVRLAFAIAAHLEPEILLVDEVLAVGDINFQKKCLGKMQDVARHQGRTVLFVSHNMAAVRSLCTRCLMIRQGTLTLDASAHACIDAYVRENLERFRDRDIDFFRRRGTSQRPPARLMRIDVLDAHDRTEGIPVFSSGEDVTLEMEWDVREPIRGAAVIIDLVRTTGEVMTIVFSGDSEVSIDMTPPRSVYRCTLRGLPLRQGRYEASIGMVQSAGLTKCFDAVDGYPLFDIADVPATAGRYPERRPAAFHWEQVDWERLC